MIDAGIREKDMVVVKSNREPKNGDIVLAEVDGSDHQDDNHGNLQVSSFLKEIKECSSCCQKETETWQIGAVLEDHIPGNGNDA
jgi:hypothetical protein